MVRIAGIFRGKIIESGELTGTFAINPIAASWRTTGEIDFREVDGITGLFKEYELIVDEGEGEDVIDLSNTNIKRAFLFSWEVPLSVSSTIWFPMDVGFPIDAVNVIVTTHDYQAYSAELALEQYETADLSLLAPDGVEHVFQLENEFGPIYIVDFNAALPEYLIPLPSEDNPETYAIEIGLENEGLSFSDVDRIVRIYSDESIDEANLSNELSEANGQYITTDWQPGYLRMYYVMKDGTILKANLYITDPYSGEY